MPELLAAVLWGGLITLLLARAFSQYRCFPSLDVVDEASGELPPVAFIVPTRNERRNIKRCLRGLLAQRYPRSRYTILVVDDESVDGTAEIVRTLRRDNPGLHLSEAGPLPEGWTGKTHACWRGARSAAAANAEWLCFVDADTAADPEFLTSAIAYARSDGRDMYSVCPFQVLRTPWERMFFPVGFAMIAFFQDLRHSNDASCPTAAANGQCLLIRRSAYMDAGGHAAVSLDVCEDTALAMRMKQTGHTYGIVGGDRVIRTRMYRDLHQLHEGLAKNIVETLGGFAQTIAAILLAMTLSVGTLGVPIWTGYYLAQQYDAASVSAFVISSLVSAGLLITYARTAMYFKVPPWYALLFPAGYAIGIAIAVSGIAAQLRGEVAWKGRRIYRQPPARARLNSIRRVASRIRVTWVRR